MSKQIDILNYTKFLVMNEIYNNYPIEIEYFKHSDIYEDFILIYDDINEKKFIGYFRESILSLFDKKLIFLKNSKFNSKGNTITGSNSCCIAQKVVLTENGLKKMENSNFIISFNEKEKQKYVKKFLLESISNNSIKEFISYILN